MQRILELLIQEYAATIEAERQIRGRFYRIVASVIDAELVKQVDVATALGVTRESVRAWSEVGRASNAP